MPLRFMVTGRHGQLGSALVASLSQRVPGCEILALGREQLDLSKPGPIAALVAEFKPDVIFNPAAWTAVDAAETATEPAALVNAHAPARLAEAARSHGALLVHWSTDFVFNGVAPLTDAGLRRGWREDDPPDPLSVYGRTKLEGEQAVLASGARALVLRTAWVWSHSGKCFPTAILARARSAGALRVVADQEGSPTYATRLAEASIQASLATLQEPGREGLYHLSGAGFTSWHGLAVATCEAAGLSVPITPIATPDWPTPARRPAWSVLDCSQFESAFGHALPPWHEDIASVFHG